MVRGCGVPKQLAEADVKPALDYFEEVIAPKRVIGRPFQPGQSGNPSGHPQEAEGLDANLTMQLGRSGARKLARSLIDIALEGSGHVQLSAIQYIYDRLEGRPRQNVQDVQPEEHRIVALLRRVNDDSSALEGRSIRAIGVGPVTQAEVREPPGGGAEA